MDIPYLGGTAAFAGDFDPKGWMHCDGRLLPIADYDVLFQLLGTQYGGDGEMTFALPNLPDVVPGVRQVIATEGVFPSPGRPERDPWTPNIIGFLGQWTRSPQLPPGTVQPVGQLLPIPSFTALFSILGTKFGGDGKISFALPDIGGNWILVVQGMFAHRR